MSSIPLSLLLFAFYIYFPSIFFKVGVSSSTEIRQNFPDRDKSLLFYFLISLIISMVLGALFSVFSSFHEDVLWIAFSNNSLSDLTKAANEVDFKISALYLVTNYVVNFLFGSLFNPFERILHPPKDHLTSWQRALNLKSEEKGIAIAVNVMTKSGILYSGKLINTLNNKDDQVELITLENPTRRTIESEKNALSNEEKFPSFRFVINFTDVSNVNLIDVRKGNISVQANELPSIEGKELIELLNNVKSE